MTHGPHDDVHTHGLADGCPRCDEQAAQPFETLDDTVLGNLVDRTRLWQVNDLAGDPRSENERKAMRVVEVAMLYRLQLDKLDAARAKAVA